MRFSLAFAALFISGSVQVLAGGPMGRFGLSSSRAVVPRELTPQEIYARALTRRKPTPRSTAQRRQESPVPPENNNSPLLAVDLGVDGTPLGTLSVGSDGASIGIAPESNLLQLTVGFSYTPGVDPINVGLSVGDNDGLTSGYPVLAFEACDGTTTLGAVSSAHVCLTSSASSLPSATGPTAGLQLLGGGVSVGVETNIFSVELLTGLVSVNWRNPSSLTVPLFLLVNTATGLVIGTGNVALFVAANGLGWSPFVLKVPGILV